MILGASVLRELEAVLGKFPRNENIFGVLVAPKFSKGMDIEVLSSKFEIILANEADMVLKIINHIKTSSTIPLRNLGAEELKRKIEDLKVRIKEYEESLINEVRGLKTQVYSLKDQVHELQVQVLELSQQQRIYIIFLSVLIFSIILLLLLLLYITIYKK